MGSCSAALSVECTTPASPAAPMPPAVVTCLSQAARNILLQPLVFYAQQDCQYPSEWHPAQRGCRSTGWRQQHRAGASDATVTCHPQQNHGRRSRCSIPGLIAVSRSWCSLRMAPTVDAGLQGLKQHVSRMASDQPLTAFTSTTKC